MPRPSVVVVGAALVQLAIWLISMGEWAGDWTGGSVPTWLVLEAAVAVVVGVVSPDRTTVVRAIAAGWVLQAAHFAVVTPKGEEHNLWAVGLVLQAFLAAVAVVVALAVWQVTGRTRRLAQR